MQLVTEENITDLAAERWGTAHDPRLAEIMSALVRHLHEFAREVRLTEDEWMAAIRLARRAPGRSATRSARSSSSPPTCWASRCSSSR